MPCGHWERAGPSALVCGVLLYVRHFPIGVLGQVWYLIVSIPDLCTLIYLALPVKIITSVPRVPDADNSLRVKELENTSLTCGSNRDLVSLEGATSSPVSDPDISMNEQTILPKFLENINIDSDQSDENLSRVHSVYSNCKCPPEKGDELKWCPCSHITRYCSV